MRFTARAIVAAAADRAAVTVAGLAALEEAGAGVVDADT